MKDFENNTISVSGDTVTLTPTAPAPVVMTKEDYVAHQQSLLEAADAEIERLNDSKEIAAAQSTSCDDAIAIQNSNKTLIQSVIDSLT